MLSKFLTGLTALALALSISSQAAPLSSLAARQSEALVGYFFVHFYDNYAGPGDYTRVPAGEQIFAHVSNGNNPLSFSPANNGAPILTSDVGTRGVRDPFIVSKGDQSQHYIIATDLNQTSEGFGNPNASRSLVIWESEGPSLTKWSDAKLVNVGLDTFRMVWAPEALWLEDQQRFMVYWSSAVYNNTAHTGTPDDDKIFVAYTTDFNDFTEPTLYFAMDEGVGTIDMTINPTGDGEYVRFIKNEVELRVLAQKSSGGLNGTWTYLGSDTTWVDTVVSEAPLFFKDNNNSDKWYVWLDEYTLNPTGYRPFEASNGITNPGWTKLGLPEGFPTLTKHGVVKPVTQSQYDELRSVWVD